MHHQACQRSAPNLNLKSEYDLHSRLGLVRAEIDLIETLITSLMSTSMKEVQDVIRARAKRRKFFDAGLFADPAWDILLELYACSATQRNVSVSKLIYAIEVPQTTGLRWVTVLEKQGLIVRASDPTDRRRIWVRLSDLGRQKMDSYFADTLPGSTLALVGRAAP